jgi:acyl carrier protein
MPNMKFFILDTMGNLQALGIPGELCVGGDGVARGYLNQPELTGKKFNKIYMTDMSYMSHIYHTGDLARWLPDGNVEFLGRIDSQVKIRGYRIEIEEIEHRLITHENIKEAVVLVRDGNLRAYVVPVEGETNNFTFTVSQLREHLSGELPDYMIPAHFTRADKIPLTANGKIDKKALFAGDGAGNIGIGTEYAAPTNEAEEKLANLWAEILVKERVGIHDNFFDLGGHSLTAMRLASVINQTFNVKVPLIAFFQVSTVKGIAGLILESRAAGDKGKYPEKEDHSLAGVKFEKKKRRKMEI